MFDGPTDVVYVGAGNELTITGFGRVAVTEAPTRVRKPSVYVAKDQVPVELRGAGRDSRQVHNFGTPGALAAASLIVCEVITPAGNWSSHPAHKHDEDVPGHESQLEEIYYFESAPVRGASAPQTADAFGSFATYRSAAGDIEINALVRTGDIALVPFGYHGPAVAAPELRPLLPERHGRAGGGAGLADHRRPAPGLAARHLGRPGDRPPSSLRSRPREGAAR